MNKIIHFLIALLLMNIVFLMGIIFCNKKITKTNYNISDNYLFFAIAIHHLFDAFVYITIVLSSCLIHNLLHLSSTIFTIVCIHLAFIMFYLFHTHFLIPKNKIIYRKENFHEN